MRLLVAFFFMVHLCSCATLVPNESRPVVERSHSLGFGFRNVMVSELLKTGFERIGHFGYFYYRDMELCVLGKASISPSGNFALYQDGPTGFLFLFRRSDQKITQLTTHFPGLIKSFQWNEDAAMVVVVLRDNKEALTFGLEMEPGSDLPVPATGIVDNASRKGEGK